MALNLAVSSISAFNNIGTSPIQVAPANSARNQILFHNPGTVDIFVAPVIVFLGGVNANLNPSTSLLGGCFRIFANGGDRIITGNCLMAWQAFSASASNNPLTVMELS